MRKLIAVLLMAVLVLSLAPAVFAEGSKNQDAPQPTLVRVKGEGIVAVPDARATPTEMPKPKPVRPKTQEGPCLEGEPMCEPRVMTARALTQEQNFEKIRAHQAEKLRLGVDKCNEKDLDEEKCAAKFEQRVALVNKLQEKDLVRIKELEVKRMRTMQEIADLEEKPELAKFKETKEFKARELSKERLQKARESYNKAKERFENGKKKYEEAKDKFESAKNRLKECKEEETCETIRTEIKGRVKTSLTRAIEITDNKLIQIKEKISESEVLTEEEASAFIALIDSKLVETKEINLDLGAKEQFNSKELKELTQKLRKTLQEATKTAKRASMKIMNSRIGGIIVKSKHLELKLERVLTKAVEKGIDTDDAKQYLDKFEALLREAEQEHTDALELFKEGNVQEAQAAMKRSHQKLQQVHVVLKNIVSKLRIMNMEGDLEEDEETEIEEEVEEELEEEEEDEEEQEDEDEEEE